MIKSVNNYTISSESELNEIWTDSRVSFWGFHFNEQTLEECIDNGDGTYIATYDVILLDEDTPFTISNGSGLISTETVGAGEYGVKA